MQKFQIYLRQVMMGATVLMLLSSCEYNPVTLALHDPIFPTAGQTVTYSLERVTDGTINSAELYEFVATVASDGSLSAVTPESLLQTWNAPTGNLSYTKNGGYPANSFVTYRWVIKVATSDGVKTKEFRVSYATRPFPVANQPAPVYVQGDRDDVFDVVFIPDTDITDLTSFRNNCRGMIRESFFDETHLRTWRRQFNYYINQQTGHATDYDRIATDGTHQLPSNNAQLAFAEGRCLMHQNNLRDYASGGLFSTEMQNRGTILHESGHALFGLADEYNGGVHWQAEKFPNTWNSQSGCEAAADDYSSCKSLSDVNNFQSGWWRLCAEDCQMTATGLTHTFYDCPCKSHITDMVFKTAADE